ncbi:MAG: ribosome recycling factor [Oscillospiraceae bacterium]|nr:ribosome recycling factor [Oscillospiraceae bacterium]
MSDDYKVFEDKMKKSIEVLKTQFASVRAGRANPAVLDQISVDYYGTPTPINQVGSIASPDPRSLLIQPWDKGLLKAIEKAIQESDLGINPQNDGTAIRLAFPQLTEERRKDLTKQVRKYAEDTKVALRNIRRDAVDKAKADKKKSVITEDDLKIAEKDLQNLTDKYIKEVDNVLAGKEKELMAV